MTQRIVIPTENKSGLEVNLAQHFRRAPDFEFSFEYFTKIKNNTIRGKTAILTSTNNWKF